MFTDVPLFLNDCYCDFHWFSFVSGFRLMCVGFPSILPSFPLFSIGDPLMFTGVTCCFNRIPLFLNGCPLFFTVFHCFSLGFLQFSLVSFVFH